MSQQHHVFAATLTKQVWLNYLLSLPRHYEQEQAETFPLILFLHGSGERGDNVELVKNYGLPKKLEAWRDCPFIVVAPQCPPEQTWVNHLDGLNALLDNIEATYRVDRQRIYLTGLSMGANGVWHLAASNPSRFAAIAPICGYGLGANTVHSLATVPTWVFHGALDPVVPITESIRMVEVLRGLGADVRFTVYPDAKHHSWTQAYDDPTLYTWFLSHCRS